MGQMNTSQARVVNRVLTTVAQGYTNQEYVGSMLFPSVPVTQRGGLVIEFGKNQFKLPETGRAPGSDLATRDTQYGSRTYGLKQNALAGKVPIELVDEASEGPGINLGIVAVNETRDTLMLRLEKEQADLARTAGTYGVNNKDTLSGASQWSHADSTPAAAIREASEAIRTGTGKYPNILIVSALVFAALREHPTIVERFKYTSKESITADMLAALLNLEKVCVGGAVFADNNTGAFSDVWGRDAILAYSKPAALAAMGSPSFAYTYRLNNNPLAEEPYYDNSKRSWLYPVIDETSAEIVAPDAGFLFTNAVAAP